MLGHLRMAQQPQVPYVVEHPSATHRQLRWGYGSSQSAGDRDQPVPPVLVRGPRTTPYLAPGHEMHMHAVERRWPSRHRGLPKLADGDAAKAAQHYPWRGEPVERKHRLDRCTKPLQGSPLVRGPQANHMTEALRPAMPMLDTRGDGTTNDQPPQAVGDQMQGPVGTGGPYLAPLQDLCQTATVLFDRPAGVISRVKRPELVGHRQCTTKIDRVRRFVLPMAIVHAQAMDEDHVTRCGCSTRHARRTVRMKAHGQHRRRGHLIEPVAKDPIERRLDAQRHGRRNAAAGVRPEAKRQQGQQAIAPLPCNACDAADTRVDGPRQGAADRPWGGRQHRHMHGFRQRGRGDSAGHAELERATGGGDGAGGGGSARAHPDSSARNGRAVDGRPLAEAAPRNVHRCTGELNRPGFAGASQRYSP